MVVDSLGRLIFVYLKSVPFHFAIMRPKVLPGYGVLPYQAFMNPALAEQAGMITEIEWRVSGRSPVWSEGCTHQGRHQCGLCPPTQDGVLAHHPQNASSPEAS
jgi:hypothetical protein